MALSDEQLDAALRSAKKVKPEYIGWVTDQRREWGRAVEAEVRKDCESLIRQMLEALTAPVEGEELHALHMRAIAASRKWLQENGEHYDNESTTNVP